MEKSQKGRVSMLYDSTKILVRVILRSPQNGDVIGCDDQLEWGGECLFEIHQMARSRYMGYRTDSTIIRTPALMAVDERAGRALPHLKSMVRAIRCKDQISAVQSGIAALAEM
jgi:hypothetical protein